MNTINLYCMFMVFGMLLVSFFMPKLTHQFETSFKAQTKVRKKVMGVLDIYGFEIFEVRCSLFFFCIIFINVEQFEIKSYIF